MYFIYGWNEKDEKQIGGLLTMVETKEAAEKIISNNFPNDYFRVIKDGQEVMTNAK